MGKELAVIDKCPSGYYGTSCEKGNVLCRNINYLVNSKVFNENALDYYFYYYTLVCPQGLWGNECSQMCQCNDRGTCSSVDGSCDCEAGWMGTSCQYSTLLSIILIIIKVNI